MTKLADFTLEELMLFIIGVSGALGGLLAVLFKSKCETIDCCCIKCKRNVDAIIEEEKLKLNQMNEKAKKEIRNSVNNIEPQPEPENSLIEK